MPKDRAEVQDQYKIGGGFLNEYEFQQNEGAISEQEHQLPDDQPQEGLRGAAEPGQPQNVAERIREVTEAAHEKVERRRKQQARRGGHEPKHVMEKSGTINNATKKSGAFGRAMKQETNLSSLSRGGGAAKSAKKGTAKKGVAKKGGAKKAAKSSPIPVSKSGTKKGAAKKGATKKAAGKQGAAKTAKGGAAKKSGGAAKKGGGRR